MVNPSPDVSDTIVSDFEGTVTGDNMAVNSWGYSLNNTDFSKIPALNNQATLVNIDHYPSNAEKSLALNIGLKASSSLPSGTYSKNVVFSVLAHENPEPSQTLHEISTMQEMTPSICAATTTPLASATQFDWSGGHHGDTSYVPRTTLTDTRDGNVYLVSKLADGSCWMSQSLMLDLTEGEELVVSNNDGTTSVVTPDTSTQKVSELAWGADSDIDEWHSYRPQANGRYYKRGITKSSTPTASGNEYKWEESGNLYNFYTATAGTGTSEVIDDEAPSSICPKGWRLPHNQGINSFDRLVAAYNISTSGEEGVAAMRLDPLNFIEQGYYSFSTGKIYEQGVTGNYWSARTLNADSPYGAYDLIIGSPRVFVGVHSTNYRAYGFSVRCVAIRE
jgi:uncharacterized protein (TIGR02145 family)